MNILDIGANDGFWYKTNKNRFILSNFTLIEANPLNEPALKELGVEYHIECLSDSEREVDFYVTKSSPTSTGASYYRENTAFFSDEEIQVIKMKTKRLDELFPNRLFDIIKIDVQGSEIDIINGGKRIFENSSRVYIEVPVEGVEYNIGAPKRQDYFDIMKNLGFTKYSLVEKISNVHEDYVFEK